MSTLKSLLDNTRGELLHALVAVNGGRAVCLWTSAEWLDIAANEDGYDAEEMELFAYPRDSGMEGVWVWCGYVWSEEVHTPDMHEWDTHTDLTEWRLPSPEELAAIGRNENPFPQQEPVATLVDGV